MYDVSALRMRHGSIMRKQYARNTRLEILMAASIKDVALLGHDTVQFGSY
jgi:hypothetical protein